VEPKILVKPGEVTTVEYIVENLGNTETTGIATFVYFPNQFGNYISKINCFCYDAQTLKPKQKDKFTLILLIDPEVTKDSKTKGIKEATIQFTFFNYKDYKEKKS
jgi:cytochrome c oxidase assembly protein subunit 11